MSLIHSYLFETILQIFNLLLISKRQSLQQKFPVETYLAMEVVTELSW